MTGHTGSIKRVSVIVPNLNCPILDQALDSLKAQVLEPDVSLEIIVVGQDKPGCLARFPDVIDIRTPSPVGPGTARNIGIRHAKGELIACMDADCVADHDWLPEMIRAHRKWPHRSVIGGSIRIEADNFWAMTDNLSSFHAYLPTRPPGEYPVLPTCNVSMRRWAFEQVGLFSEKLLFDEDADWMMRARREGFTLRFHPAAEVWHRPQRQTFQAVLSHARTWGSYSIITRRRYQDLQPLPFPLRRWWSLLLASPLIAAAVTTRIYARSPRPWRHARALPVVLLAKLAWCWGAAGRLRRGGAREWGEVAAKDDAGEERQSVEKD
jgi:GT2 family glycosyltransferase